MSYIVDKNGNYKRTVRCSHCYELGHNQSSCGKRKIDIAENVERYTEQLKDKNLDDWRRSCIEGYLRGSNSQLEKIKNRGKNRKCGFCSSEGHTRRTCKDRKSETDTAAKSNY